MNAWLLARRGMRHYWRTHLGVVLGVITATAVLVGALAVGDSVRLSLRDQALSRIGRFESALAAGDRHVRDELATSIAAELGGTTCVPILQLAGVAARGSDSALRTGIVDVFGVDDRFFTMSTLGAERPAIGPGHALLNARLARQLDVAAGDEIVVRVEKPSPMPLEATMATVDDVSFALRVTVDGVLGDDEFGRFSLRASQVPPFTVFLPLAWLQQVLELPGRVNLLAIDAPVERADAVLRRHWTIADAELSVTVQGGGLTCELASSRVFLDEHVVDAMRRLDGGAVGVLTWFVNTLHVGDKQTPYSTICALGPLVDGAATDTALAPLLQLVPSTIGPDQIVLNDWLARALGAAIGDPLTIDYWVMGADLKLAQQSHRLRVHSVVPLVGAAADPGLMPAFPGLAEARSCRDWEPGVPVDLQRLGEDDQEYWNRHRGTPKAFVSLATGQQLWQNRFGSLTAVRTAAAMATRIENELPRLLEPARLGLFFQDLRGPAIAAGAPATDFGGLFLGLSFFLIVAALLLTALLFVFGIEQRQSEIGALLAFGYEPVTVRWLFLREAIVLLVLGSVIGAGVGVGYAHAVLAGLGTLWRDTIGETTLTAHIVPATVATGALSAIAAALLAIAVTLRKVFRRPAVELLGSRGGELLQQSHGDAGGRPRGRTSLVSCLLALAAALTLVTMSGMDSTRATSAFFGGGALLLLSALFACRHMLLRLGRAAGPAIISVTALGLRNSGRRPGRSLATIALLASGTFLVTAIQGNRLEPPQDASLRSSGTGGFALFGRSTLPVLRDLETEAGRDAYALDEQDLASVSIVPLRVRDGDDASCLNLSTAQNAQLVGVRAAALAERSAFRFTRSESADASNPWLLLDRDYGPNVVPAIGDGGSVAWALHKQLGDSLRYRDEAGNDFDVRIVGTVADSILQGNLVIADRHLQQRFPSATGYRMFLVDAPPERVDRVTTDLTRALQDIGLELTPTGRRLAAFQAVQNTYLSVFLLLGGLGLLLGTVGLGVVVLRNALERRSELAVARAVGFSSGAVRRLVFSEHGVLLALGLGAGVISALLAILPAVSGPRPLSLVPMLLLVAGIALSGVLWVWIATALATRGRLLDGLRSE